MKRLRIKDLNQRITIFSKTETGRDSEDYPVYTDVDYITTWARAVADSNGITETEKLKGLFDATRIVFTIRYRHARIDNTMFIRHNGNEYAIVAIDPCEYGNDYIQIHAKRTVLQ